MRREVLLPLYGRVLLEGAEWDFAWDLLQTRVVQRLHDISLSSTPARFIAAGMPASRFQHSLGVMLVADRICSAHGQWHRFRDPLMAAAALHDAASPPMSHISEPYSYLLLGRTHEQDAARMLDENPEIIDLFDRYEVDADEVKGAICGTHPVLGPLLAGDLDADSIDNSLGLLRAITGGHGSRHDYHPFEVADLFEPADDGTPQLHVTADGLMTLLAWRQVRIDLYTILASEAQMSAATSLLRAFSLSADQLDERWMSLGEHEALAELERSGSEETRRLLGRLSSWKHLHCVARTSLDDVTGGWQAMPGDMQLRVAVEDALAGRLGLRRDEIAVYAGYSRKTKQLHIPMVGDGADAARAVFGPNQPREFRVAVFAPGTARLDADDILAQLDGLVGVLGDGRPATKTFF